MDSTLGANLQAVATVPVEPETGRWNKMGCVASSQASREDSPTPGRPPGGGSEPGGALSLCNPWVPTL